MTTLRIISVSCALFCLALPSFAGAQSRLEVAGHAAMLRFNDLSTNAGFGGRVTFDVTKFISLEGEVSLFPDETFTRPLGTNDGARLAYHRRRTELLAGAKIGYRSNKYGLFARVRPGIAWLAGKGIGCDGDLCALILVARPEYQSEFALDLGGTVEFYPTARSVARVDLGDVMIWHRSFAVPPCSGCTSHNLTSRVGFGLRF